MVCLDWISRINVFKRYIKKLSHYILWWPASPRITRLFGEFFFRLTGMRAKHLNTDFSQIKSILVVRLDEIGDVVMTTPFLRELRRLFPNAWISLVVKPQVYNLVELCPYVNEILIYDWNVPRLFKPLQRHWRAFQLARNHLWKRRFDLAILPRWDTDNYHGTFVAYFSGAPLRVGYSVNVNDWKRQSNKGFDLLLTHTLMNDSPKHEVEQNLSIIHFLGGEIKEDSLELWLGEKDEIFAEEFIKIHNIGHEDFLIALGPGAGSPKRQWPPQLFVELGEWLIKRYKAKLLVIGGCKENAIGQMLRNKLGRNVLNMAGMTTLRQAAALLKRCRLFIGNDSGPMHLAAAVGTPVIELSCHPMSSSKNNSVNSPYRFGPWRVRSIILQPERALPPCVEECIVNQPHCILGITIEQVKQAVLKILSSIQDLE